MGERRHLCLNSKVVLNHFSSEDSEDLFCDASPNSESSRFFIDTLFSLGFGPVQDNFQYDFTWMTDGYDVLAELKVSLFRENNQRL